jgi:hypothetical protein
VFYKVSLLGVMQGEYGNICTKLPRLIAVVLKKYSLHCVLLAGPSCSGMCVAVGG